MRHFGENMKLILEILGVLPITKGADRRNVENAALISKPYFRDCCKGEVIMSPGEMADQIYVLCSGKAIACSPDSTHTVTLRSFQPYELFGISNLFANQPFATKVTACTDCTILVLDSQFMSHLIDHDRSVRYEYISYLAQKTLYLNKKIACLTAGSAEQRVARWLDNQAQDDTVAINVPMSTLCTMLDIGRASLYRAFDCLENDGFIKREGKVVFLYNREKMLSFYH
jgi:CRP-like cAMP-binding protein